LAALRPVDFLAALRPVDFFAALRPVDFFADFLAPLRLEAFFFGAAAGAVGVIIDIMSAIILVSPV
jgi:hypothetical protein